ncbi:MAG: hypothetical protein AB4352_21260 [Hormoscilla sp.]
MTYIPKNIGELVKALGKEKHRNGKYECPNCGEIHLSIARDKKQYDCYSCHETSKILSLLWQEWRDQNNGLYEPRKREERIPLKEEEEPEVLFFDEWDAAGRSLSKWLGLSPNARTALAERGYDASTIKQMAQNGWFSIPAGRTEVTHIKDVPENFPGTQWWQDDTNLKTQYLCSPRIETQPGEWESREAIAIPRYRWDGFITGYQLRLIGAHLKKDQRYRFLYGGAKGSQTKIFTIDGREVSEGALTVCDSRKLFRRGELTIDALNFVEANLKPHICSYKHGGIWVGANSNTFASSPAQLQEIALEARSQNIKILRFHLDARTLPCEKKPEGNPGILINWAKLAQYFYKNYPEFEIEVYVYGDMDPDEVDKISPENCLGSFNAVFAAALKRSRKLTKAAKALIRGDRDCEWVQEIRKIQRWLHRKLLGILNDRELQRIKAKTTTAIVLRSQSKHWGDTYLYAWPVEGPPYLLYDPNNSDSINYTRHKHSPTDLMPPICLSSTEHYEAFHRDAYNMGCQHLLNITEAGGGKSHNTALLDPEAIGIEREKIKFTDENGDVKEEEIEPRILYFVDSPKNPTNIALEERTIPLPARAEELFENPEKTTPKGNSYIHSSDPNGNYIPIPHSGNCGYASHHSYLNSLGYSPEIRYGAICLQCPAMIGREKELNCSHHRSSLTIKDSQTGEDIEFPFGFLSERVETLSKENAIRLHHSQTPPKENIDAGPGRRTGISDVTDLVIHDDCIPQTSRTYYITAATCDKTARILRHNHEVAIQSGDPNDVTRTAQQLKAFDPLLTRLGDYIEKAEPGRYGIGDPEVRSDMAQGKAPNDPTIWTKTYNILARAPWKSSEFDTYTINPDDHSYNTILMSLRNSCSGLGSNLGEIKSLILENKGKPPEESLNALRGTAIPQFLRPLILAGLGYGSFRIVHEFDVSTQRWKNKLAITIKNRSEVKNSRGAFNIQLDATMNQHEYSQLYGVQKKNVWVMHHLPMDHSNLTVFQYQDLGKLASSTWSQDIFDRLTATISFCIKSHTQWAIDNGQDPEGIGLIAPKWLIKTGFFDQFIPRSRQGWWFAHTRGTNIWQNCHTLYCVGSPRSCLGQLAVDWQVRTGESVDLNNQDRHPDFRRWANGLIRKEQIQTTARLRSGRTEGPKNLHWFCSESLTFLEKKFPGCKVSTNKSRELTIKAAPKSDRHLLEMAEAIISYYENDITPTQQMISGMIDWSTAQISKTCKQMMQILVESGEVKMAGRQWFKPFVQTFISLYKTLIAERKFSDGVEITEAMRRFAETLLPKQLQSYLDRREKILEDQSGKNDESFRQRIFDNAWHVLGGMIRSGVPNSTVIEKVVTLLGWGDRVVLSQVMTDLFPTSPGLDALEYAIDVRPALLEKAKVAPPVVRDRPVPVVQKVAAQSSDIPVKASLLVEEQLDPEMEQGLLEAFDYFDKRRRQQSGSSVEFVVEFLRGKNRINHVENHVHVKDWINVLRALKASSFPGFESVNIFQRLAQVSTNEELHVTCISRETWEMLHYVDWDAQPSEAEIVAAQEKVRNGHI